MLLNLRTFFTGALLMMSVLLSGQNQIIGLDLLNNKGQAEVPFEIEQGFIIVKIWLNGIIPLRMIFDTGAENTIIFDREITQILGIKFEREIPIMGSDLDSVLIANIARNVKTKMDGCNTVNRDVIVLQENTLLLREKLGTEINGIVGGSYFSNLVVKINYKKRVITFNHPVKFKKPSLDKYYKYPINVVGNKPYIKGDVAISNEVVHQLNLLLDTGAALPFLIHTNTDTTLTLPERIMVGNVGFGLSGAIFGYRGKSKRFELGEIFFNEIVTSFQDLVLQNMQKRPNLIRNGIIGNTLLSRFIVIIDYTNQELYLRPTRKYNQDFSFDKSGITLFAVGQDLNQYYVVATIEGSPADLAGVLPGDLIVKVGRKKTKKLSLNRITEKLSKKEGKLIKLTLLREDEEIKVSFRLKEWFNDNKE